VNSQTITLRVAVDEDWDAGDGVQVYSDFGGGEVDTDRPLLAAPFDLFPGQQRARGVGVQPVGLGRVGDGKARRPRTGIGQAIVGVTPVGTATPFVEIPVEIPAGFGTWKFAVQAVNSEGVVQGEALAEIAAVVSATEPPPLRSFGLSSYDSETDQVVFNFTETE